MTVTLVACPLARVTEASHPSRSASSASSSRWSGRLPDSSRLADTEVP